MMRNTLPPSASNDLFDGGLGKNALDLVVEVIIRVRPRAYTDH